MKQAKSQELDLDDLLGRTLTDFADLPRWVAWRLENDRKIPKNPHTGGNASATNPTTWGAWENAAARARRIGGGVGIVLGDHAGGCLGGVDLDGCRDPETGKLEPWAAEILQRLGTNAEVSPSGTGVKAFFQYDPANLPRFREHFLSGEFGRQFAPRSHYGVELYLGDRWFAVTGERIPSCPVTLREMPAEDLVWLLADAGPRLLASVPPEERQRVGSSGGEGGRSEQLMTIAARVKGAGEDFEAFRAAAEADPVAWAHVVDQGREKAQERALERAWNRSDAEAFDLDAALAAGDLDDMPPLPADDPDGKPDLSDDRLARDFARVGWKKKARWCGPLGGWQIWDGARWARAERLEEFTAVRAFLVATAAELEKWAARKAGKLPADDGERLRSWAAKTGASLKASARIAAVESLARSNPGAAVAPSQFDSDDLLLGTPGGVVDLRTGEMRPADRADYITKTTAVAPAAAGERPERWLRFLAECFPDNPEIPPFLQRLAGYALTGETREHKVFFFWGTGRNGKGTFLNTLTWLLGDYAATVATSVLLESRTAQHTAPLAMLRGARLARGSEISAGAAWDESTLKRISGGDPITANLMRQDPITFTPKLTLIVDANRRPRIRTVDPAMAARMVLVPFAASFVGREDTGLADALRAEGPAILRWAIRGAVAWQREGLGIPESIRAASAAYLEAEDDLGQFLAEHTETDPRGRVESSAIYRRFLHWQDEQGIRASWSKRALAAAMQERGFERIKFPGGKRGFVGLRLMTEPDPFADVAL